MGRTGQLTGKTVLELGAGTGLTSFVAAMYTKKVVCTGIYTPFEFLVLEYGQKIMEVRLLLNENET